MTFLRWAGSKKQLLDVLSCCWYAANCAHAKSGRYIEAFSGSAALFFRIKPRKAILVDINSDLQNCLQRVRDTPTVVSNALEKYTNSEEEYYRIRASLNAGLTKHQRAAAFIYLNRNCFNGLYRTNARGQFNVPFGGDRAGKLPTRDELCVASATLQSAELLTGDFFEALAPIIRKNDFVYLDPPYAQRNRDLDNQYGPDVFGTHDIERLSDLADIVHKQGGTFLISYAQCEEIQSLATHWHSYEIEVKRTIAASVKSRQTAKEVLITNL